MDAHVLDDDCGMVPPEKEQDMEKARSTIAPRSACDTFLRAMPGLHVLRASMPAHAPATEPPFDQGSDPGPATPPIAGS